MIKAAFSSDIKVIKATFSNDIKVIKVNETVFNVRFFIFQKPFMLFTLTLYKVYKTLKFLSVF